MTNFGVDYGDKLLLISEQVLSEIADPDKALLDLITDNSDANRNYLELKRIHSALRTYLDTDPDLRYVALVGSFSSGKTATINSLLGIAGTDQARREDINPVDEKLTLCAHESKKDSLLATLLKSDWDTDKFFHQSDALDAVEGYRKQWEQARQIIEKLYQESDDKVTKFKSVATTFKERTMDRTRQLFGNRGHELERYIDLLEDSRQTMREIQ